MNISWLSIRNEPDWPADGAAVTLPRSKPICYAFKQFSASIHRGWTAEVYIMGCEREMRGVDVFRGSGEERIRWKIPGVAAGCCLLKVERGKATVGRAPVVVK
jgi:hypothetical protein